MRNHYLLVSVVAALACAAGSARAQRCIGPKDNSGTAQSRGVDPIAPEDITWCDDFDSYCESNRLAESRWPGYPPDPDNLCGDAESASTQWFQNPVHWPKDYTGTRMEVGKWPSRWEGWDGNPGWTTTPYTVVYSGGSSTAQYHTFSLSEAIAEAFGEGFDSINGTDDEPLVLRYWMYHGLGVGGAPLSPLYIELRLDEERAPTDYVEKDCLGWHDCTCALLHQDANCDAGTCDGPACKQWVCDDYGAGDVCQGGPNDQQPCYTNADCLKTCNTGGPDWPACDTDADCKACVGGPTPGKECVTNAECGGCVGGAAPGKTCTKDYDCQFPCGPEDQSVCDNGPHMGDDCTIDDDCAGDPVYPIVAQQWLNGQITVPAPPLDTERRWSSLAFGMLAQTDRDPCTGGTGIKPTQYHACTFDGNRWWDLRGNVFPGVDPWGSGDFNYDEGQAFFEIKIKSTTYEAKLIAPGPTSMQTATSTAIIPRKYLGPFNRISMGTGPGCKLDPETGECLGPADIWRYPQIYAGTGWQSGYVDRPALLGGVPGTTIAACCLPDGGCDVIESSTCRESGGVPRPMSLTCEDDTCLGACCEGFRCSDTLITGCSPDDFQGIGSSCATTQCPCPDPFADTDGDGDVDQEDFALFQACFTGHYGGAYPTSCHCFNQHTGPDDPDIDEDDWAAFEACASGPDVLADPACDGTAP